MLYPTKDTLLVRRSPTPTTSEGGIYIPVASEVRTIPNEGVVVAAGKGRFTETGAFVPNPVKVGDTVIFGPYTGTQTLTYEGEELAVMLSTEVIAVREQA
jgi:chaperonin GroES